MVKKNTSGIVRNVRMVCLAAFLASLLGGCLAEKVTETTEGGSTEACDTVSFDGFDGTPTANANWTDIQEDIFAVSGSGKCMNCHVGADAAGNGDLHLSLEASEYDAVVTSGVTSGIEEVDLKIVEPGFRDCSFIYRKVSLDSDVLSSNGEGSQMPLSGSALSDEDIERIGVWIDEGAIE